MSEEKKIKLSPEAFTITPKGEVVIDSEELARALKGSVNPTEINPVAVSIGVVVGP